MKKTIKVAALAVLCTFGAKSNLNAQVFEKGDMVIDAYYGFPNLYTSVFRAAHVTEGTSSNVEIGGLGPLGGRFEYMVSKRIGLGLDIGFNNTKVSFTQSEYNGQSQLVNYDYNFSTQKLGVMATFNIHFLKNSEKFDFYGVLGIGYGNRSFKFSSTNPNYISETVSTPLPIAARLGVGFRYMFSDQLGANCAIGAGQGGILNLGLSYKL